MALVLSVSLESVPLTALREARIFDALVTTRHTRALDPARLESAKMSEGSERCVGDERTTDAFKDWRYV